MSWIKKLVNQSVEAIKSSEKRFKEKVTEKELTRSYKGTFKYYEKSVYAPYLKKHIEEGKHFLEIGDLDKTEEVYYEFSRELMTRILGSMVALIEKNIKPLNKTIAKELKESIKKDDGDAVRIVIWTEFINKGRWKPNKIEEEILSEYGSYFCSIGK